MKTIFSKVKLKPGQKVAVVDRQEQEKPRLLIF